MRVFHCATGQEVERPTVNIRQGMVDGIIPDDGEYFALYGIPDADPTAGVNWFEEESHRKQFRDIFHFTLIEN